MPDKVHLFKEVMGHSKLILATNIIHCPYTDYITDPGSPRVIPIYYMHGMFYFIENTVQLYSHWMYSMWMEQ